MPSYCKVQNVTDFNKSPIESGYALLFLSVEDQNLVIKAKTDTGQFITITDKIIIGHCGKHLDNYTTRKIQ